jgi:hypothetical protein
VLRDDERAMKKTSAQLSREIADFLGQRPALSRGGGSARLEYRAIGRDGDPWPPWLRAFKEACGVYVIRESGKPVYAGSSKKRLYDTVTRHFQQWKRKKNWWKGLHGAGHDPGLVYSRGRCEVAAYTVACGEELVEETNLIERLQPRDNLVTRPDGELEDAPF